jgi:ribosome recycling factor
MTQDFNSIYEHAKQDMEKSIAHLESELVKIRAGKANPQILESVHAEYYGNPTPLFQVANISAPDARTLLIQPWEKNMIHPIEKAIMAANLGFNPQNDGTLIRISIPPLTEERRKDLVKKAKAEAEHGRVSIRNIRKHANEKIKEAVKGGLPEDDGRDAETKVQQLTDSYSQKIDKHLEIKEKEIMTV